MSAPPAKPAAKAKPAPVQAAPPPRKAADMVVPQPHAGLAGMTAALIALAGAGSLYAVSPATFMVLATGLTPTVVAFFFETGRGRSVVGSMAALNIAGVAPVISFLWGRGDTMAAAAQLLRDPFMWLLMYGSAALAVGLLWAAPRLSHLVIEANAGQQRARLVQQQLALVEEWGNEVAGQLEPPAE